MEEDIVYPLREDEIDLVKKHVDIYNQQKLDETGKIRITLNDQELLDKPLFKENLSFMEQMVNVH